MHALVSVDLNAVLEEHLRRRGVKVKGTDASNGVDLILGGVSPVRKVFGGTIASETERSVREYMVLVGIAVLVGIPVAVFLAERYLRQFWYRIEGYGWVFIVGAVIALLISFLAVLWQTLKAARTNPAVELKKE